MTILGTVLLGLVFLSILVVFHEFGHFLAARAFGIRVERFSVGFGKPIVQWRRGDTTWSIASIPLGGFVRMAGESVESDDITGGPDEFMSKPWWQRFVVVTAGPIANLAFALVANCSIGVVGFDVPHLSTRVESVEPGAAAVGFARDDRLVAVGGEPVESWYDFQSAVLAAAPAAGEVAVTVERASGPIELRIPAGSAREVVAGLAPWTAPVVGRAAIGNPAYQAGLRAGDRVLQVGEVEVSSWSEMREEIVTRPDQDLALIIRRGDSRLEVEVHTLAIEDESGRRIGQIGISPDEPTVRERLPLGASIAEGFRRTGVMAGWIYGGLWQLVTHLATVKDNVAGPITIVQMMGASRRLFEALNLLALFSIALMAINLLPIPILDGGHALFALIEGCRGTPLTLRSQLALQKVGLVIIGSLVVLALLNDVRRVGERVQSVQRLERQEATQDP